MADFEVIVYPVDTIIPHENADSIEIVKIGNFNTIVRKDSLKLGDKVAYIPPQSVLPDGLIEEMGLTGRLAGSQKNRVKEIKLRGVLSEGLVYPMPQDTALGIDVQEQLGITKYEPIIPASMSGLVESGQGLTMHYDIENIKKYPELFKPGDYVSVSEKIHGTWCCLGMHNGQPIVTSKGLSARNLRFKINQEGNHYVNMWHKHKDALIEFFRDYMTIDTWYVLGEIYGRGIQDLQYGTMHPEFRIFDVWNGTLNNGFWLSPVILKTVARETTIPTVPIVWSGRYSDLIAKQEDDTSVLNKLLLDESSLVPKHLREGVVITADPPTPTERNGTRLKLKAVSEKFLLRKGGTEYQ